MVKFRRSSASKSRSSHQRVISVQEKDPTAIIPPKKVIRALYDWDAPQDHNQAHFLSFTKGEYLHVISREDDTEWYEANNPLLNSRGLVPVSYFEQVGKSSSASSPSTQHDSGYADRSANDPARMSKASMSRGGAPVYGVVAYDFKAERPDELEAHEGEAIIVIAQSNPEWFVAKPITRLGGPGLIPVSFVEIKDLSSGRTIDTAEAIARAGIPRVEEWKKMAAEYKNTSIPLGQISQQGAQQQQQQQQQQQHQSMSGLQSSMDHMSLNNGSHSRKASLASGRPPSQAHAQFPLAPLRASVPRYMYSEDKFHFIVEATLADGTHWDLTRIYEDFYELQINLIKAFPDEAGNTGQPRTLPLMPGPVQLVTDRITDGRRENLDEYLYNLLHLGSHVVNSTLVRTFFSPRSGDYEVDPELVNLSEHSRAAAEAQNDRYSTASHASGPYDSPHISTRQSISNQSFAAHQRQQSTRSQPHFRSPSEYTNGTAHPPISDAPPPLVRQTTAMSTATASSVATSSGALKVKVWFDRETCVVLRLPPRGTFGFEDLHRKIVERRRLEYGGHNSQTDETDLDIEYRDERTGDYYPLSTDESLDVAIQRNDKLTLVVRSTNEER